MILHFFRKRKALAAQISTLSCEERRMLLHRAADAFGCRYLPEKDIFTASSCQAGPICGSRFLSVKNSPGLFTVFNSETICFSCRDKTWLILFQKGQYGILTGGRIGIYCSRRCLAKEESKTAAFYPVSGDELPACSLRLIRNNAPLPAAPETSGQTAVFYPGLFSRPQNLTLYARLTFPAKDMQNAFIRALTRQGYPSSAFFVSGRQVCFSYRDYPCHSSSQKPALFPITAGFIQFQNRIFCRLFLWITNPFCLSGDRILHLYLLFPQALSCMGKFLSQWL